MRENTGKEKYKENSQKIEQRIDGKIHKIRVESDVEVALFENQKKLKMYEWLTTEEAARYLKVSAKYLLNLSSNGRVRYFKFGRRNRFLLSDLNELLLAQPRGGTYGN